MIFNAYANENEGAHGLSVVSGGHIFAQNGRSINRPHGRNDWLLFYIAKENETFFLDREIKAEAGSFILFKPFEKQQHIYTGNRTAEFYYVHFRAEENFTVPGIESSKIYQVKPGADICDLFEDMINELQMKLPCYEQLCAYKLLCIFSILNRKLINQSNPNTEYLNKIAFVIQKMNREYGTNYSLEEYADMCQMGKYHFLRVFKSITGDSPIAYRNRIRMEHAKEMLEDTCLPVNEIGQRIGYDSPSCFCDAFKKETGFSPIQFRQKTGDPRYLPCNFTAK